MGHACQKELQMKQSNNRSSVRKKGSKEDDESRR